MMTPLAGQDIDADLEVLVADDDLVGRPFGANITVPLLEVRFLVMDVRDLGSQLPAFRCCLLQ